jgi:enoyl-CoA hydratase/carnithine racemase
MTEAILLRDDADGVATLTLNRPQARNALSLAMLEALQKALADIAADTSARVVVIRGAGPAFCAGHDLKEVRGHEDRAFHQKLFETCSAVMQAIIALPQPVIAQIHGVATAAGCQLAATCDLAYAAASSRFATPGVNIGLFCSTPMVALSRAVGNKAAMELLLTGDMIDAATALRMGLINQAVADAELEATVRAVAVKIAAKSPYTLKIGKQAFYRQKEMGLAEAYAFAGQVMTDNMQALDAKEGIDAFLQKRHPTWCGR